MKGNFINAQNLFHQDIFYGGVTSGGFSTGQGQGSGTFDLYIEPGSTIRKAYLFSYRMGYPPTVPITVNGTPYIFDSLNCIMTVSHTNPNVVPIKLYYEEITADLNSAITSNFNITIPDQFGLPIGWGWFTAFIYIEYDNPALPRVATSLWVNDKDYLGSESYIMNNMNPVDTNFPIGLSLFTDRTTTANGVVVSINSNVLGTIEGSDNVNSAWNYGGPKGHFYYQNNLLFALDDDIANATMTGADALADVSTYISNGATNYNLEMSQEFLPINLAMKNLNLLFINAYTTPCDTFSTSINTDTVICKGDSIQLFATGGTSYSWLPQDGLTNPTITNPYASPDSTTLYVVQIESSPGCSRTEKVLVKVNEPPKINSIVINESICGDDDGEIIINATGSIPLEYSIGIGSQIGNTFPNLSSGNYTLSVLDGNGCSVDTAVFIPEINPVNSFFTATPESGVEPLLVDLNNGSLNANNFDWYIDNINFSNAFNTSYNFDNSGTYTLTLIAYYNLSECADTFSIQIIVYDSLMVQIPNVFTPNDDGINDVFSVSVDGAKEIKISIVNRWGNIVYEYWNNSISSPSTLTIWDGKSHGENVSDGVYYYTIEFIDKLDKKYNYQGFIHVLN